MTRTDNYISLPDECVAHLTVQVEALTSSNTCVIHILDHDKQTNTVAFLNEQSVAELISWLHAAQARHGWKQAA